MIAFRFIDCTLYPGMKACTMTCLDWSASRAGARWKAVSVFVSNKAVMRFTLNCLYSFIVASSATSDEDGDKGCPHTRGTIHAMP